MRRFTHWQISVMSLCVVAVLAALVVSGLGTAPRRTFAASTADIALVATLHQGQHICEGPLQSEGAFKTAFFWNAGVGSAALVEVHAGSTADSPIASHALLLGANAIPAEQPTVLTRPVDSDSPVTICLTEQKRTMTLYGASASYGGPSIIGSNPGVALWLKLYTAKPKSLFSSLPEAFRRASLFRPSWVGAWTFWVLLFGLLGVVPLGVVGLHFMQRSEQTEE